MILETLAAASGPRRLRDISLETGIPKSTALGILRALVARRFAETDTAGYRLGLRAFETGAAYLRGVSPAGVVHPALSGLAKMLDVTAHFAILDGSDVLYLEKHDPPSPQVHLASAVGARLEAYQTAVGLAQLAMLPPDALAAHIEPGTRDAHEVQARLAQVRARGYAVDDEQTLPGVMCVAAPVLDTGGRCCGAIGVSFPKQPRAADRERIVVAVRAAAWRASERLGWRAERMDA